jgi:hypothetical protein
MDGAVDYKRQLARYSIDMTDLADAAGADAGDPALFRGEMIQKGLVMYMRMPFMMRELPGGKDWIKIDLGAAGKATGIDLTQLQQAGGSTDPSQFLQYLRGAGRVEERGEEEVRGTRTTRYHAIVKMQDVVENAPEEQREALQETMDNLERQLETDELPVDVWIDEDGRCRRMKQAYGMSVPGQGRMQMAITIEFFDFGTDISVKLPAASEVASLADLAAGGGDD